MRSSAATNGFSEKSGGSGYRPEIDGLRALAVIAVIVNHFNTSLLPSGHLGVDIFFVISGYVITASLAERKSRGLVDFLLQFYARRIKRLAPALITCVVLTGIMICLFDYTPGKSLATGLSSLFGLSNVQLFQEATDYFASSTEFNVFTQTWSLGVEEQFYLIFPAMLWATGFGKGSRGGGKVLVATLGTLFVGSLLAFIVFSRTNSPAAYFLMPLRFWELAAGCLVYVGLQQHSRSASAETRAQSAIVRMAPSATLVLLVAGLWAPSTAGVYPTIGEVGLTAFLLASLRPNTDAYELLTLPAVVTIGLISYSLYLWHWSVLSLGRWTVGIHWWSAPIQAVLMLAAAVASYHYVERPLRRAEWSAQSWKTISYGAGGLVTAAAIILVLHFCSSLLFIRNYNVMVPPERYPLIGSGLPFNPTCVVDRAARGLKSNTFDLCTVAPTTQKGQTIFALGDSHAGALQGLLYGLHERLGVGIHLVETPGVPFPMKRDALFPARQMLFDKIMERIHPGDVILLARIYFDRTSANAPRDDLRTWYSDVEKLGEGLGAKGIHVVVVGPMPIFHFDKVGLCRPGPANINVCAVPRNVLAPEIDAVQQALEDLARRSGNIHIFEPFRILCPEKDAMCSPVKDGIALFWDSDHLNTFGARSLTDDFARFLRQSGIIVGNPQG